jgi:hypothetical protein
MPTGKRNAAKAAAKNQEELVTTAENQETEVAPVQKEEVAMFNAGTLFIPNSESLGRLEQAETGMDLTVKYRKQEEWFEFKNKPVRAYFMGIKEIPNEEGEMIIVGAFFTSDGPFLAGQKLLIDAVKHLEPNTPIEITFLGKKENKSSKGSTNMFEVKLLRINITPKLEGGKANG